MNILALDTCTEMCSAAIEYEGQLYQTAELAQRGHSDKILDMLQLVLNQAGAKLSDIQAIAFGRGPGSFTGVRIGVGVAQGIAFAQQLPVAAVSSLAAVAQLAMDKHNVDRVAVAMDARMGEVYAAHYIRQQGIAQLIDAEQVCKPALFKPYDETDWFAAGTGWSEYDAVLKQNYDGKLLGIDADCFPQAEQIIRLAKLMADNDQLLPAEQALPVYLRDNVAKKKGEQ